MSILGVSNAVTGVCQHMGRTQKNTANGASFTGRAEQTQEVSNAEKLENFKKEIWHEINSMPWGANTSIQITDGAFRKMMEDSEFKNKMMKIIREDAVGSNKRAVIRCLIKRGHHARTYYKGAWMALNDR